MHVFSSLTDGENKTDVSRFQKLKPSIERVIVYSFCYLSCCMQSGENNVNRRHVYNIATTSRNCLVSMMLL